MKKEVLEFSRYLFDNYQIFRVPDFPQRDFVPEILSNVISKLLVNLSGIFQREEIGRSFEDKPIQLISGGNGTINILFWSQMHGDESTATMALCDIINYLTRNKETPIVQKIFSAIRLNFLPMLNPDGAARFQRRTAQGIDMNRDALALETPEAQLLKSLQHNLKPQFGFNLHDQELSSVGSSNKLSAIGLLAPAFNSAKTDNESRERAKHLAAVFATSMNEHISGYVTKYDDSFEPRAFGDNMQKWGTSTLLVESGHTINDPEKDFIRKLNFVGMLTSIYAIALDCLKQFEIDEYNKLPFNGKRAYDLIIRNVIIRYENRKQSNADLGISYQVDTHSEMPPKLVDLGDLRPFVGLREIDGSGKSIPAELLNINQIFKWEKLFQINK
ncbi:MAG: peptidase M14 [Ignavibacteriales bacterium]|nr:peptidase M14 [Ignavibacteriales bacterium]